MGEQEIGQLGMGLLVAMAIAALVFALAYPYFSGDKQGQRRLQSVTADTRSRRQAVAAKSQTDNSANRKKQVADTLKDIENQRATEKVSLRLKMERAGLDMTLHSFYVASAISGAVFALVFFLSFPGVTFLATLGAGFAGAIGFPRWVINFKIKRRQGKFLQEFANSIDVIVRGVKSGLPLNECLAIIARESPEPLTSEFREVVEQQRVGVPLGEALEKMTVRMPLAETRFFAIVIAIQQQAGGNLSEALGNLSGVLRDRKRMQMKVSALSAEAKASAGVLASLPIIVMLLVYITTPKYIAILWSTKSGQFMLMIAGFWMFCGIMVMRKMINFKY